MCLHENWIKYQFNNILSIPVYVSSISFVIIDREWNYHAFPTFVLLYIEYLNIKLVYGETDMSPN